MPFNVFVHQHIDCCVSLCIGSKFVVGKQVTFNFYMTIYYVLENETKLLKFNVYFLSLFICLLTRVCISLYITLLDLLLATGEKV